MRDPNKMITVKPDFSMEKYNNHTNWNRIIARTLAIVLFLPITVGVALGLLYLYNYLGITGKDPIVDIMIGVPTGSLAITVAALVSYLLWD